MNDPPTALVGFENLIVLLRWDLKTGSCYCGFRLSMNDPPTALVGFRFSHCLRGLVFLVSRYSIKGGLTSTRIRLNTQTT